jgi:serine/threonine protein kinase
MLDMLYYPEEVLIERYPFVVLNRNLSPASNKIRIALKLDDDPRQDKLYAVKLIRKSPLSDLPAHNLIRGISIHQKLSSLDLGGFVRLLEVLEDERCFYLIMEALDGDLVSLLEQKRTALLEEEAKEIFKQTIQIVMFMHSHGVVHRDLKLDNFMIAWDSPLKKKVSQVKLSDFDFAEYEKEGSPLYEACGSPPYAAPELTVLNPIYDGRKTDMWSLGVLLFVLVCGKFPWYDPDMLVLFQKIQKEPLTLPSHLSDNLKDLLSKLLDKDPLHRITIPNIVNHAWFRSL